MSANQQIDVPPNTLYEIRERILAGELVNALAAEFHVSSTCLKSNFRRAGIEWPSMTQGRRTPTHVRATGWDIGMAGRLLMRAL